MKTLLSTVFFLLPALACAQVPVDDNGNVIGNYETTAKVMPIGDDGIPRLSESELQELVGPIALYPDDLLAIVLPASAYPLQIVEASRFLEALESDPTLKPDPNWDDSIVALINYPEVIELLNEDLDWTWRLGEAVVAQQSDVVGAVESFRDRAYAAGNLKTDSYQTVARNDGVINISPASEEVIYVPYYEPARVVHYQPRPVYYYYPQPYPVYYYPYSAGHYFDRGFFWGVTTAFSIGWMSDSLHVYHHSYRGHPYYGHSYWNDRWYRRPSINVYNTTYVSNSTVTVNRYSNGDRWRPRTTRREYVRREGYAQNNVRQRSQTSTTTNVTQTRQQEPIAFRERNSQVTTRTNTRQVPSSIRNASQRQDAIEDARERQRDNTYRAKQRTTIEQQPRAGRTKNSVTPVKVYQEQVRRAREQAPARAQRATSQSQRSQVRTERAPARAERTPSRAEPVRSAPRSHKQASRSQESRAPSRKASSGSAKRSERKSNDGRSRSRDRQQN